jgi:hypothetical protein
MTYSVKIINNAGSLSESDLELLAGTEVILSMLRNRILVLVEKKQVCDWSKLTDGMIGLYYIRTIDQNSNLFQLWFETEDDLQQFEKNLTMAKIAGTVYE